MVKKNIKNNSFLKKVFNSDIVLYIVFILALLNIGNLLYTNDNEGLFLFIMISFIVYTFNKNMIFVLLSSLITVNILNYLKKKYNNDFEGFEMKENFELRDLQIWLQYYFNNSEHKSILEKYKNSDKINDYDNIYNLINPILEEKVYDTKKKLNEDNKKNLETLVEYLNFIDDIDNLKIYKENEIEQIEYIKDVLIEDLNNYVNSINI